MLLAVCTGAAPARAAGPIRHVPLLWSFRVDYQKGIEWQPDDVVEMLRTRPGAYLFVGNTSGYVPGSPLLLSLGRRVDRWQRAIADYNAGHDPDLDAGHICVDWRPDLVLKPIDGSGGEQSCGSLLGEPVCAPAPCSAHPDNPCTRWQGDMEQDWGPAGVFRTDWLLTVPAETWKGVVQRYYDGADFCEAPEHRWSAADRRAICRANTDARKVMLYGRVNDARRRLQSVSGVGLDLRKPEAREWNARQLLSRLSDLGIDPGEPGCVLMGYKPGMWADVGASHLGRPCPGHGARSAYGYATPDNGARCAGPLLPSPYGPGEFEAAMNEQMRLVFRVLDQPAPAALQKSPGAQQTYSRVRFIFTERPAKDGPWSIWQPDVRDDPHVLGEMANYPTPLSKRSRPAPARPAAEKPGRRQRTGPE